MNWLALQKATQVIGQFPSCRVTSRGLLGHGLQADRLQVARNQMAQTAGPARLIVQHLAEEHLRGAAKRQLAR